MNTVHRVLDSHGGGRVNVFKVETNKASFEKCLEFALTKEAEIIDIRNRGRYLDYSLRLSNLIIRLFPAGLKCLKELCLSNVNVNDQDIALLVSNVVAIESLSMEFCWTYVKNVKIVGHPKLKHLDISYALNLESIEIRDVMSLVSLKLYQLPRGCALQLSNIPKLIKLSFREHFHGLPHAVLFARLIPSCIRDQLQLLHLATDLHYIPVNHKLSFEFVNIKHLELVLYMDGYAIVDLVHPLIEACSSLQKLQIKSLWCLSATGPVFKKGEATDIYSLFQKKLSPNLREMEIIGYFGCPSELELASYIIKNAAALRELVVVACDLNERIKPIALARARRDFRPITPPSIKLLIM